MQRLDINDAKVVAEYEAYLEAVGSDFMQSTLWAKVKQTWQQEIYIYRNRENQITGSVAVLIKKLPILPVTFIYSPRGPLIDWFDEEMVKDFKKTVKMLIRKHRAIFFKMEPYVLLDDHKTIDQITKQGFKISQEDIQCKDNYILRIEGRDKQEVYDGFKKQWRYNIRYAPKKGVTCDFYGPEKIDDFYKLLLITAERDNFPVRAKSYFTNMMDALGWEHCKLCMCYLGDEPLSAAMMCSFGGRVSYVYGASSNEHRQLMPNYLMQWTMISYAMDHHMKIYDFLGIPHFDDPNSPNYGTYHFKKGFNGEVIRYVAGFDYSSFIPHSILYRLKKYMPIS